MNTKRGRCCSCSQLRNPMVVPTASSQPPSYWTTFSSRLPRETPLTLLRPDQRPCSQWRQSHPCHQPGYRPGSDACPRQSGRAISSQAQVQARGATKSLEGLEPTVVLFTTAADYNGWSTVGSKKKTQPTYRAVARKRSKCIQYVEYNLRSSTHLLRIRVVS